MSQLLANLNPEQLAAVTLPARHALILAGAGSGKTRVLTTRIAWLIQNGHCSPQGILAVTFTNKAAKEMIARLTAMFPINTRGMWIGTFHGLCNRLLRAHHREAGLPQLFQILDSGDQLSAIKRLLKALNVDDDKFPPRDMQHYINAQKEAGVRPQGVEAWDDYTRRRLEIYVEYEAQCQREGVVDFPELLLRCYELLERNEPIRRHYQSRFRHILVDEFQDTNVLQYRWLKLLADNGQTGSACLFCVGDDDQSIYRFRGAEVGNMRDFERDFRVTDVVRLEQNYRSQGNILDAANALITHNSRRLGKNLWTDQGAGEPIRVYEAYTDTDEARFVVEEIQSLVRDGGRRDEIALLYRSNAQSRVLEHQLFSAGIPYRVYGGLRFFERQEVKHALAYMRLLANPDDDTAFQRVVNFPTRGIGARSLEALQDAARTWNTPLYQTVPHLSGKPGTSLAQFVMLIERIRQETACLPLPECVEHVLTFSGLRAHYEKEKDGQERLENLDELVNAAASFQAEAGAGSAPGDVSSEPATVLAEFLAHASLEAGDHQADAGVEAVQLMTVHAAKGLEFDVVFLSGLEEGLFPHENSASENDGLEEERRLMYVAVTRARRRLYLSFTQSRMLHGQVRYNMRSRFLEEIPDKLLKWLTPRSTPRGLAQEAAPRYYNPPTRKAEPSMPPPPPQKSRDLGGFRIGQTVRHPRFGDGTITAAEGSGQDARVEVRFAGVGSKWLMLSMAKLEAV
ncbi:MAG: UvrD-helicase domain-containing protein [Zoogloea sp.]|uniref:UvrD-helicase domain-containing protein n=1 Tax=Zoogloea sp. TaxID=49181 RepID=UPI003F2F38F7